MSYANGTTHYNLPQTVGTDKRDWSDTNQAFADVDAALHTAAETASTAASNISTLDNQINGVGGIDSRLTTAENDIDNVEGAVSTLQTTVAGHTSAIADVRQDAEDMITAHNEAAAESTSHYDIGEEFIYNDVLYRATAEINIGDTIVPNTNCSATNVMTEVNEINTALSGVTSDLTVSEDSTTYSGIILDEVGGMVCLRVHITGGSFANGVDTQIATLATKYKPTNNNIYTPAFMGSTHDCTRSYVKIAPTGEVYVHNELGETAGTVDACVTYAMR